MFYYIAAIATAMIIMMPALRGFFMVPETVYAALATVLLICAIILRRNLPATSWQLTWRVCLISLFFYLLIVSFPFYPPRPVLIAGGFLISSIGVGLLCSLDWPEKFYYTIAHIIIAAGLVISVIVAYGYVTGGGDFRQFFAGEEIYIGYLSLGSYIALAFCIVLPFFLFSKGKNKLIYFLVLSGTFFGLVVVLSRGAILFSGAVALFLLIFYWPWKKNFWTLTSRIIAVIAASYIALSFMPERTFIRLNRLFFGHEFIGGGRGRIWASSINKITDSPLIGHGLGDSSVGSVYPHNPFLQVGIDGGSPAMILLAVIIALPVVCIYKIWKIKILTTNVLPIAFFAAYVWLFLEYSKTGNFYKARDFFIVASLLVSYLSVLYKKTNNVEQSPI